MILRISHFLIFISLVYSVSHSQGCSDAGVCSTGELYFDFSPKKQKASLVVNNIFGLGEQNTFNYSLLFEFNYQFKKHSSFQFRIPYHFVAGNLATIGGLGDFILSYNRKLLNSDSSSVDLIIGAKLPSNNADFNDNGNPLPMAYQTSLGTYDLILGLSYSRKDWFFAAGYQHPLNRNKNEFLHTAWTENKNALKYNESNQLKRGDDVMLRINYLFRFNHWNLNCGFLPIYHLQNDEIIVDGENVIVDKSNGFTYNVNFTVSHNTKKGKMLRYTLAAPLHAREVRPDGTTRTVVLSADITFYF